MDFGNFTGAIFGSADATTSAMPDLVDLASEYGCATHVQRSSAPHSISKILQRKPDTSTILGNNAIVRKFFDPANKEHRMAFYEFNKTGKWVMKFHNEYPNCDVVATITGKLLKHFEQLDTQ